ncbi:hypothetical protein P7C73_g5301, partial [Tremellales sp. Uapishka_1]
MSFDLPPHLQTLNILPSSNSPPSSAIDTQQEEAFWQYLNTDELFSSFSVPPAAYVEKPAGSPVVKDEKATAAATNTLESFLATFVSDPTANVNNFVLPPVAYTPAASTSATENSVVNTAEVMATNVGSTWGGSEYGGEDSVSGAKRLKKMGAGVVEIEEDKRRRNTEASARFRLKKKEREQALERRAKELEAQVATLSSEKASLEKENTLLKFIVVNGNGATGGKGMEGIQGVLSELGKRKRE